MHANVQINCGGNICDMQLSCQGCLGTKVRLRYDVLCADSQTCLKVASLKVTCV